MTALTVLSLGGGQDSITILYKMVYDTAFRNRYVIGDLLVIMANTGDEHPQTYEYINYLKTFCFHTNINFVFITNDMGYHYEKWPSLIEFYRRTNTIGSKGFGKTCTDKLKIQVIYKYIEKYLSIKYGYAHGYKRSTKQFAKEHGKIRMILGIAADETGRIADDNNLPKWMKSSVERCYPLIDIGYDRAACQDYIKSAGHEVPLPSNCMRCPYMSEKELLYLYRFHPNEYYEWVDLEQNKINANMHMGERNLGVWAKKNLLLPDVLKIAIKKYNHMTDEELFEDKMSHGHCVKSKY